jgi:N-acetylated-alpha-linked acidic dipeptidase
MMRLANADVLPVDFNSFYKTINDYTTEIKALLDKTRTETADETSMLKDKLFDLAKDSKKVYLPPPAKELVPYLNFSSLDNALVDLKNASEECKSLYAKATSLPAARQNQLNTILYQAERSLLQQNGLPRRSWYQHQIYAPGFYTGYGVKTIPGIREAVEQRFWKEAQENIEIVAKTVQAYTEQVKAANGLLK